MFEQGTIGISWPLLAVLVFWLAIVFASFGLFAPPNATVIATLFLCALSVSGAIFLILEMYTLPGTDPDLRRSDPDRPGASRPVKGVNLLRRWFWVRVPVDPRCTPGFCGHRVTCLNADGNTSRT